MARIEPSTNHRRPTITDVAQHAGVSIKTVSRVFNREPNVRQATRDKVHASADALSYQPLLPARQLASNLTYLVGLLYDEPDPENQNEYLNVVQSGVLQACREYGYHLLINPCSMDSRNLDRDVSGLLRQVDGLIVLQPLSDLEELTRKLRENNVPCVRISQRSADGFPRISVGDTIAADEMTDYLVQLGHRRIGFIVGHPDHGQSHDRHAGYRQALARNGIAYEPTLVEQGMFDYESGRSCGRRLLSSGTPPTAIFASNDAMAMGVLSVAHEMGLDVPRQLSVAGFDDSPMARHAWPALTTVRQPIAEVARVAAEELLKRLKDRSEGEVHHCLQARLVRRASTASPATKNDHGPFSFPNIRSVSPED